MRKWNSCTLLALWLLPAGLCFGPTAVGAAPEEVGWRRWTAPDGAQIEAYLKEVRPNEVVVVRQDGREFATPLENFSREDRAYITEWAQQNLSIANFREIEFEDYEVPESHRIEELEHRKPGPGEPLEPTAIQMVLDFHGIDYDEGLAERISVREHYPGEFIPPRDLVNALKDIPVEIEILRSWDPYDPEHDEAWQEALKIIQVAISMNLPVVVGYRPYMEIETPELVGIATGYDRQNLEVLEPAGSSRPERFHLADFKFMFAYAMIIFPTFEPPAPPVEELGIDAEFLNLVSGIIRELPVQDPILLTHLLQKRGLEAEIQDVNRTDYSDRLGKTRLFAREGGIPLIDVSLDNGRVVVVPQEYDGGEGFALIYGRVGDDFTVVHFLPDRTFERGRTTRGDLARKWLTREDRTYRLDLIQIALPRVEGEAPSY